MNYNKYKKYIACTIYEVGIVNMYGYDVNLHIYSDMHKCIRYNVTDDDIIYAIGYLIKLDWR